MVGTARAALAAMKFRRLNLERRGLECIIFDDVICGILFNHANLASWFRCEQFSFGNLAFDEYHFSSSHG